MANPPLLSPEQAAKIKQAAQRMCDTRKPVLRDWLILEIAREANLTFTVRGTKAPGRCPFHDDKNESSFLSEKNFFYCSVCTPDKAWTAKHFAAALNVHWPPRNAFNEPFERQRNAPSEPKDRYTFTAAMSRGVWSTALARSRNDECAVLDAPVFTYAAGRGVMESWELRAFGVLGERMALPACIAWWPRESYRIIAPLYDHEGGELVGIQARAIVHREGRKKVLAPTGGRIKGTLFANVTGLALLRGELVDAGKVILAEGLTDYLALSIVSQIPVLSGPGTGSVVGSIGPWVRGLEVYLALDFDEAGEKALHPAAQRIYEFGGARVVRVRWPADCSDACDALQRLGTVGLADRLRRLCDRGHGNDRHAA